MPNTFGTPKPIPELQLDVPVIYLDIYVKEIEKIRLLYDRIEVWRSTDNITYTEITAPDDLPATIDGTVVGPWSVSGTTLTISKNSTASVSLTFGGTNPVDLLTIINTINVLFYGPNYKMASEVPINTNRLSIKSDIDGLESSLLLSGSACSVLGLSTTLTFGKNHRIILTEPTVRYRFYDTSAISGPTYYYKIRYSHSKTGRISSFSDYILGDPLPILTTELVTAYIKLSDHRGNPVRNKRIVLVLRRATTFGSNPTISAPLIGVMDDRIEMITDQFGFASTKVPKGGELEVYIEDTLINRIITVPTTDFDLLDKVSQTADPFNLVVQVPVIPIISST